MIIAGPCSIESKKQISMSAEIISGLDIIYMRAGAFKPRTSPTSFQGLKKEGLIMAREAADLWGLKIVSEVLDVRDVSLVSQYADILQTGARNMQNYELLKEVGKTDKPILFKRGLAATLYEWFSAAEYIGREPFFCERGHRTYMKHVRFMLDIAAIFEVKKRGYKIIVDPSHAAGQRKYVRGLAIASIAAGADGLIIEMHPDPSQALSDNKQQLNPNQLKKIIEDIENEKTTF